MLELRFGPISADGYRVVRSGVRWLRQDGHLCRQGEVVGFCNIGLVRTDGGRERPVPFAEELPDLQIALATPVPGRLRQGNGVTLGGFHDYQQIRQWRPDNVIGYVESEIGEPTDNTIGQVQIMLMAGRRVTELAEIRSGLMTGWHDRSRACRVEGGGPIGTLLSLGTCEMEGVVQGESYAFLEILGALEGPAHVVFVSDRPLVHSARIVAEQIRRTADEHQAIAEDFAASFVVAGAPPDAAGWTFVGSLLRALGTSPATERYTVLARDGLREAGPPDAVILSARAEPRIIARHRKLGYCLNIHGYRVGQAGAAFQAWLRTNFEPVHRTSEDIRADYRALIDLIRTSAPATQFLICNVMSTSGQEDIQTYGAFDQPLGNSLSSVRSKETNLMLHDLAGERDIAIIDADAIAAELGGWVHIPDGVHQNGAMQTEIRSEILRILRARGVPGFAAGSARVPI